MFKQIKNILLSILKPFQIMLQRLSRQETKINSNQVAEILLKVRAGDIFLSYEAGKLTSPLIKGFWDHAAIVSSKLSIMEAVGNKFVDGQNIGGVREVNLEEWLYKKDAVCLIRPMYEDITLNKIAAANSFYYKGKPYDYLFTVGEESIYCSELVYLCYINVDKHFMEHVPDEILPELYFDMTREVPEGHVLFKLIFDSREK